MTTATATRARRLEGATGGQRGRLRIAAPEARVEDMSLDAYIARASPEVQAAFARACARRRR